MLIPNLNLPKPSLDFLYDIHKLRDEMNKLLEGGVPFAGQVEFPPVNMCVDNDNIIITAELPGVDETKVNITVKDKLLNISGSRTTNDIKENNLVHRAERFNGEFSKTIELPTRVDSEHVNATYKNGILKLVLPRAEEEKVKKIEIKSK